MNYKKVLPLIVFIAALSIQGIAQLVTDFEIPFEIKKVYPSHAIDIADLDSEINTLSDINRFYKDRWVNTYNSVTLSAYVDGKLKKAISSDDKITKEQKELIKKADYGTSLEFLVDYLPENNLDYNPMRTFDFSFTITPHNQASFKKGKEALENYFSDYVIDKLPSDSFTGLDLAAYTFTIGADGQVIDTKVFEPSKNEKIDELAIEALCNMPNWNPASYTENNTAAEEFVFLLGNNQNCMINLLNIDPKKWGTEE
jgi:hypothetical protein